MFTIEQLNDLHARLGSARTLPEYVRALKARMTMTYYDRAGREMLVEQIT